MAEPALNDFLDTFLSSPLDFQTKHADPFQLNLHEFDQHHSETMGSQAGVSNRQPHAQPHPPAERFQAQTFTDVLANVANDRKPEEGPSIWGGGNWGGSFATPGDSYAAPGEWGGSFPLPQAQALEPDRSFGHLPESSSNNGNLHAMQAASPLQGGNEGVESDRDSDVGQGEQPHPPSKSSPKGKESKETVAGRAEQRRTRKREKDRIEELQAGLARVAEEKGHVEAHTSQLAKQLQEKDEELRKLRAAEESALPAADDDRLAASFEGVLRLTVQDGKDCVLKPDQISKLSEAELISIWAMYARTLRDLLHSGAVSQSGSEQQRIMQRIHTLQREAMLLSIRSAISNILVFKRLCCRGRMDGKPGAPDDEFWHNVNQSLKLSPSQQGMVLELWQSFQGRMSKLMEVRASIHSCMQGTMPDGVFGRSFAINFLKAHELMDALKYNLRQEHIVLCDVFGSFHKILTPLQWATCIVRSWPYWTNTPKLVLLSAQQLQSYHS